MTSVKLQGVWPEDARPLTLEEMILPKRLKESFQTMIDKKEMSHMIFVSSDPGTGKSTLAQILGEQMDTAVLFVKGSEEGGIDAIRGRINDFVMSANVTAFRSKDEIVTPFKIVYVDEADGTSAEFQKALRTLMNDYKNDCRFIFTLNHESELSDAVFDRFATIRFEFTKDEKQEMAEAFYYRVCSILKHNEIKFEESVVADIIMSNVPRFRRVWYILYEIYLNYGEISQQSFNKEKEIESVITAMNTKNYNQVIKSLQNSTSLNLSSIFSALFQRYKDMKFDPSLLVYLLSEYQSRHGRCADKMLNFCGFYNELLLRDKGKL